MSLSYLPLALPPNVQDRGADGLYVASTPTFPWLWTIIGIVALAVVILILVSWKSKKKGVVILRGIFISALVTTIGVSGFQVFNHSDKDKATLTSAYSSLGYQVDTKNETINGDPYTIKKDRIDGEKRYLMTLVSKDKQLDGKAPEKVSPTTKFEKLSSQYAEKNSSKLPTNIHEKKGKLYFESKETAESWNWTLPLLITVGLFVVAAIIIGMVMLHDGCYFFDEFLFALLIAGIFSPFVFLLSMVCVNGFSDPDYKHDAQESLISSYEDFGYDVVPSKDSLAKGTINGVKYKIKKSGEDDKEYYSYKMTLNIPAKDYNGKSPEEVKPTAKFQELSDLTAQKYQDKVKKAKEKVEAEAKKETYFDK